METNNKFNILIVDDEKLNPNYAVGIYKIYLCL